jgi:hypothetical protein
MSLTTDNAGSVDNVDEFGYHAFRCNKEGFVTTLIPIIFITLLETRGAACLHAGYTVSLEPYGAPEENKR